MLAYIYLYAAETTLHQNCFSLSASYICSQSP